MLLPDNSDLFRLLRNMRSEIAQNRTDIQRLWRLVAREHHEPFFVIGGDAEESSSGLGGSDASGEGSIDRYDGGGGPGGGPGSGGGAADGCCLWIWDGDEWHKILDNTNTLCVCPEPDTPGNFINEIRETCCPESSAGSGVSSSGACSVVVDGCEIPCVITWTVAADPDNNYWQDLNGSHALTWNGQADPNAAWIACEPSSLAGVYNSKRIVATYSDVYGVKSWWIQIEHYLTVDCSGGGPAVVSVVSDSATCVPVFGEGSEGVPPTGPNTWEITP